MPPSSSPPSIHNPMHHATRNETRVHGTSWAKPAKKLPLTPSRRPIVRLGALLGDIHGVQGVESGPLGITREGLGELGKSLLPEAPSLGTDFGEGDLQGGFCFLAVLPGHRPHDEGQISYLDRSNDHFKLFQVTSWSFHHRAQVEYANDEARRATMYSYLFQPSASLPGVRTAHQA